MGALKYTLTLESDSPPQIYLGAVLGGAVVIEMKQEKMELVSATELAKSFSLSVDTIRRKLAAINQGTEGKHLYDPVLAAGMLKTTKSNRGRKRAN